MFGFYKKVSSAKILVCSIGNENILKSALEEDTAVYKKYYRYVESKVGIDMKSLIALIETKGFDIVHILGRIDMDGNIDGEHIYDFHYLCGGNNVKLVFWAFDNDGEVYSNYFKQDCFNLVFTENRRGRYFVDFLDSLLSRMSAGKIIFRSWVEIVPQIKTAPEHETAPDCILRTGGPKTVFLP